MTDAFDIIQALAQAVEDGEELSGEELMYLNMAEEAMGISINQIEFIRTHMQSQKIMV
jgi:hypothetical protein